MIANMKRVGTLLPVTSLVSRRSEPGTFAAGLSFIDWLAKSRQSAWQLLPLHQTELQPGDKYKHVSSPYKGYGIGLDPRFLSSEALRPSDLEVKRFRHANKYWVENYALFCALRNHYGTDNWLAWDEDVRRRDPKALRDWQARLERQIEEEVTTQTQLHFAYSQLQTKARENKILLIGDMPFYLGLKSPLVWQYQHLFELGNSGQLRQVSGVLAGVKSYFGRQIWGHPLYSWQRPELSHDLAKLFEIRIRYLASIFDYIRLDYANGLFKYGALDVNKHANDQYLDGPGKLFFERLIKYARAYKLRFYAEDTRDSQSELPTCLHKHHLAGLRIFRFAYNERRKIFSDQYLKTGKYPLNTVAYTTTHDTESLMGYLQKLSRSELQELSRRLRLKESTVPKLARAIRDKVIRSPAKIVIVPLQDWLLTTDRINTPGTERVTNDPNWRYVMDKPIEDLPVEVF